MNKKEKMSCGCFLNQKAIKQIKKWSSLPPFIVQGEEPLAAIDPKCEHYSLFDIYGKIITVKHESHEDGGRLLGLIPIDIKPSISIKIWEARKGAIGFGIIDYNHPYNNWISYNCWNGEVIGKIKSGFK